jgi:UDP-N-acetylenolpyruvoylglucosamine reductase
MTTRKLNSTNYSNQVFLEDRCTLNELISLLSKRWMTDVLFSIEEGNNRFTTLKEELQHISDNILADRLRARHPRLKNNGSLFYKPPHHSPRAIPNLQTIQPCKQRRYIYIITHDRKG